MTGRFDLLAGAANVPGLARIARATPRRPVEQTRETPAPLTADEVCELSAGAASVERFCELFNRAMFWGTVTAPPSRGILQG